MDTQRIATSHQILHHTNEIELATPVGSARSTYNIDPIHQQIHQRLDAHFRPHRNNASDIQQTAAARARIHNDELDAIRDDRSQRLFDAGYTVHDMDIAERNANIADRIFATFKSGIGGSPFAAVTMATNTWPSMLEVFTPRDTPEGEAALQNALASWYAGAADASVNDMLSGLKPEYYQKPPDDKLHGSLQSSLEEKREAYDKGSFGNAMDECNKWLVGFAIRNAALYPIRVGLESQGKQELAAAFEAYMRPVTAVIVGIAIEHYNLSRDQNHNLFSPAMLYGRRDTVAEGHAPTPITLEHEWLDEFIVLRELDSTALLKMVPARLGAGTASAIKSIVSGENLKAVFSPTSIVGNMSLAGGFAAMGGATTAARRLATEHGLSDGKIAAAAEAVKNTLGAVAFGLWAAGATLGESESKKAVEATDAHVAKGVEGAMNSVGRSMVAGAKYTKDKAAGIGSSTVDTFSSGVQISKDLYHRGQRGLSQRYANLMNPSSPSAATSAPAPAATSTLTSPSQRRTDDMV
jgi:hypothetical protein